MPWDLWGEFSFVLSYRLDSKIRLLFLIFQVQVDKNYAGFPTIG